MSPVFIAKRIAEAEKPGDAAKLALEWIQGELKNFDPMPSLDVSQEVVITLTRMQDKVSTLARDLVREVEYQAKRLEEARSKLSA
jgi:hypothetical protein